MHGENLWKFMVTRARAPRGRHALISRGQEHSIVALSNDLDTLANNFNLVFRACKWVQTTRLAITRSTIRMLKIESLTILRGGIWPFEIGQWPCEILFLDESIVVAPYT
jgi:hypothetical protein